MVIRDYLGIKEANFKALLERHIVGKMANSDGHLNRHVHCEHFEIRRESQRYEHHCDENQE